MGWTVARWLTNTAYQTKTSFSEHYFEVNLLSHNHILDYDRPWMYKIIHGHVQYICFKPTSGHQEDNQKNSRYHTPRQTPTSSPSLSICIWNANPPHMPSWAVLRTRWAPSSYLPPHCPPQKTHPTTIRFVSPHFFQPCFVQTAPQKKKGKKYSVINLSNKSLFFHRIISIGIQYAWAEISFVSTVIFTCDSCEVICDEEADPTLPPKELAESKKKRQSITRENALTIHTKNTQRPPKEIVQNTLKTHLSAFSDN